MHTYRNMGDHWCVGFRREGPVVRFEDIKDFPTEDEAAAYASFLNGGGGSSPGMVAPEDGQLYAMQNGKWAVIPPPIGLQTFDYLFSTSTTPPPGAGQVRLDNADQTAATKIWIDHATAPGVDVRNYLPLIKPGGLAFLQDKDDATKLQRYNIVAVADMGAYHEWTVQWLNASGALSAQRILLAAYSWG